MKILRLYCEVSGCKKTFRNQVSLEIHLNRDHRSVEEEVQADFKCSICFKSLSTKQSLKEHIFTHSGEKPYKCLEAGCGLLFRQSSQLSNHKKVHLEIKKNTPAHFKINLAVLSNLISIDKSVKYVIPQEPFSLEQATLPPLLINALGKIKDMDEVI